MKKYRESFFGKINFLIVSRSGNIVDLDGTTLYFGNPSDPPPPGGGRKRIL